MQIWEEFPVIYGLLNKTTRELDSPLNDYGVSNYSDNVIEDVRISLKNMRYLLDVYAAAVSNKRQFNDLGFIINPRITMELDILHYGMKGSIDMLSKCLPQIEKRLKATINELEAVKFYRFNNTDVSNLGPFDSEQSINFKNPFTLVVGPNGAGKTTIKKKLESNFPEDLIHPTGLYNLSFLIFFTEKNTSPAGSKLTKFLLTYGIDKINFDLQVNKLLQDFYSNQRCYSRLIDKNYPAATGEVIMMNIVINFTIRKILCLDYPIVLDEITSLLDTEYLELLVSFLKKNCSQVIFLTFPDSRFEDIGLNSDYHLQLDNKTQRSIILNNQQS